MLLVPITVGCVETNEPWHAAKFSWHVERLAPGEVRQSFNESWHEDESEDEAGCVVTVVG